MQEIPINLSEALYLAAELARKNEALEAELTKLRLSGDFPEVLHGHHICTLMGWTKAKLSNVASDPTFPHLDGARKKGESIRCRKSDFYDWLKNRKSVDIDRRMNVRHLNRKSG